MKKICFMGSSAYGTGGVETMLTLVSNELSKYYEVMIISYNSEQNSKYEYNSRIKIKVFSGKRYSIVNKVEALVTKGLGKILRMFKLENSNSLLIQLINKEVAYPITERKRMIEEIKAFNPDLTIGVGRGALFLGLISEKIGGKKIGWQHSSYDCFMNLGDNIVWSNLNRFVIKQLNKLDCHLVLTEKDKIKYKNNGLQCEVMPNFLKKTSVQSSSLSDKVMVAIGRLAPEKQFDQLVEIWSKFHIEFPDWKLKIYGDGPEEENIRKMINKFELKNSVEMCGFEPNIEDVLTNASMMLMTSKFEGFPLVILEAFSVGVPVISYDIDGASSLIEDEREGYLIPLWDKNTFVDKMKILVQNNELINCMNKNCIDKAKQFSEEVILNRWKILAKSILEDKK